MSNSIWNKYDIKDTPDENKLVVLIDKDDGFYNARFVDKIDWVNDWYNHIEKWCYLDCLIAQADKAERLQAKVDELEHIKNGWARFAEQKDEQIQRLQKAVDLIANMEQRLCIDDPVDILDDVLKIAKDEIKQLIKE